MDPSEELTRTHSRENADRIAAWVLEDVSRLDVLMASFFDPDEPVISQRAAMVVGGVARARPQWLLPYLEALTEVIERPGHPALRRAVLRYFSEVEPRWLEPFAGRIVDGALRLTDSPSEPVAVRVFAMQVAANLGGAYPELADELRAMLLVHLPGSQAGFRSRATKILRDLTR
ncbi:hypothetical protein [Lewinella sp. IMCC34183]|uniref:hypothetical protein n=1 Tax=Lewinella sp. IMCC34183 TaxID=2248762 RepID=UPI000E251060|nr:hypothetical protein [Lewinella sp. IMCC34183]